MNQHPDIVGVYPGRAETFVFAAVERARAADTGVWVGWRPAREWEAVVVERAYARLLADAAEGVRVAGREGLAGFTPGHRGEDLRVNLVT